MIRFASFLYHFRKIEFALLTKFFNDEGAPSNSPGWQKEKISLFLGFDFETSELAFFEKMIF
jgi:hypothetical protein